MNTKLVGLLGLWLVAGAGCGGSGDAAGTKDQSHEPVICDAALNASQLNYTVSGTTLTLLATDGTSTALTRIAAGSSSALAVFGTWKLPTETASAFGLVVAPTLDIEAGKLTLVSACTAPGHDPGTATVTSTATVTEHTITIDQDVSSAHSL